MRNYKDYKRSKQLVLASLINFIFNSFTIFYFKTTYQIKYLYIFILEQ